MSDSKKKNKEPKTIHPETIPQSIAFIEQMMMECIARKKPVQGRFSVPYKIVVEPDPDYEGTFLVVNVRVEWDVRFSKGDANAGRVTNKAPKRH